MNLELVNLEEPSETRHFEKGRFDIVSALRPSVGRATSQVGAGRSTSRRPPEPTRARRRNRTGYEGGRLLLSELWVRDRLGAVDEFDDRASEEGPENRLEAEPLGKHDKEGEQEERPTDADLRRRVL
jgi:hypothetical protein